MYGPLKKMLHEEVYIYIYIYLLYMALLSKFWYFFIYQEILIGKQNILLGQIFIFILYIISKDDHKLCIRILGIVQSVH